MIEYSQKWLKKQISFLFPGRQEVGSSRILHMYGNFNNGGSTAVLYARPTRAYALAERRQNFLLRSPPGLTAVSIINYYEFAYALPAMTLIIQMKRLKQFARRAAQVGKFFLAERGRHNQCRAKAELPAKKEKFTTGPHHCILIPWLAIVPGI